VPAYLTDSNANYMYSLFLCFV